MSSKYNEPKIFIPKTQFLYQIFMENNIVMNFKQTQNVPTPKPIIDIAFILKGLEEKKGICNVLAYIDNLRYMIITGSKPFLWFS